jgi:hypothetical protein
MGCPTTKRMRKLLTILGFLLTGSLVLNSCYYDVEEELYGTLPCDTSNVTFANSVLPIINANCVACHSDVNPSGGISLASHAQISTAATNGSLIGVIEHQVGFSPMPKNANQLNLCDRRKIQIWIDGGMPNN